MKIRQRDSAIEAYYDGHESMEKRVLRHLRNCGARGATILEIAVALGVESNCVTGRLTDLSEVGLVTVLPVKRRCDANPRYRKIVWVAVGVSEQLPLFKGAA